MHERTVLSSLANQKALRALPQNGAQVARVARDVVHLHRLVCETNEQNLTEQNRNRELVSYNLQWLPPEFTFRESRRASDLIVRLCEHMCNMCEVYERTVELDAHEEVVRVGRQRSDGGHRLAPQERLAVASAAQR